MTSPVIQLEHFLHGPQLVQATIVDGHREWKCPHRPMMRPWIDGSFKEPPTEIEDRLRQAGWNVVSF